jgi:ribonuclease BN (tRNA processing enzyme)
MPIASVNLTFLGTADAFHSGNRRSSSYLLRVGEAVIVVDCGPTTPLALKTVGTDPSHVHAILQTHFHGDHLLGLPMLLLHHQVLGGPPGGLKVYGPPGTRERVLKIYELVYERSAERLQEMPELVDWLSITANHPRQLPLGAGTAQAFEVLHSPEAVGYRVEVAGRTIVFTGDTRWDERLVEHTRGADLLVIDCTSLHTPIGDHLAYDEILEHADDLGAQRIILSHLGQEVIDRAELELEMASDGLSLEL